MCRVSFSIPVVVGSGERKTENGERKTEFWRRVGIVFDTCGCGGAYMYVGGAKVVGKISPPQKRVLRRVKSNF